MRTYTGKYFYPDDVGSLEVDIEDIAHALSMMNRYCGHLDYFYSVAQHSLIVEELVCGMSTTLYTDRLLGALLHDASEAYMPDMPSPIKQLLPDFKKKEEELSQHIFSHYNLAYPYEGIIKEIDSAIRGSEIKCLTSWEEEWGGEFTDEFGQRWDTLEYKIIPMPQKYAEEKFLQRFYELYAYHV